MAGSAAAAAAIAAMRKTLGADNSASDPYGKVFDGMGADARAWALRHMPAALAAGMCPYRAKWRGLSEAQRAAFKAAALLRQCPGMGLGAAPPLVVPAPVAAETLRAIARSGATLIPL